MGGLVLRLTLHANEIVIEVLLKVLAFIFPKSILVPKVVWARPDQHLSCDYVVTGGYWDAAVLERKLESLLSTDQRRLDMMSSRDPTVN